MLSSPWSEKWTFAFGLPTSMSKARSSSAGSAASLAAFAFPGAVSAFSSSASTSFKFCGLSTRGKHSTTPSCATRGLTRGLLRMVCTTSPEPGWTAP
eukprot:scaffold14425_cov133-Isochrysis_galbana.AAC.4